MLGRKSTEMLFLVDHDMYCYFFSCAIGGRGFLFFLVSELFAITDIINVRYMGAC
jgi:hypothetical protein